jgi:hypothetical protein
VLLLGAPSPPLCALLILRRPLALTLQMKCKFEALTSVAVRPIQPILAEVLQRSPPPVAMVPFVFIVLVILIWVSPVMVIVRAPIVGAAPAPIPAPAAPARAPACGLFHRLSGLDRGPQGTGTERQRARRRHDGSSEQSRRGGEKRIVPSIGLKRSRRYRIGDR